MIKVLTCLATEHDLRLVLVAGLVCFVGCFTAFKLYSRLRTSSEHVVRAAWVLLIGLVAGCSVWATHFIAMLAYESGLKSGFQAVGTLVSLLIPGVFMAGAFLAAASTGRAGKIAGGILAGLGVGAMHYAGMSAYVTQGTLTWDLPTVAVSLLLGVGLGVGAMFTANQAESLKRQLLGALVLTLAICGLHFTGMGAITIAPDAAMAVPDQLLSKGVMTFAVFVIVGLIILGGLGAVSIEGGANEQALVRIRRLADAAYEGIVVVRGDRIQDANAAFCALAGAEVEGLMDVRLAGEMLTFDDAGGSTLDTRREGRLKPRDGGPEIPVEAYARLLEAGGDQGDLMVLAVRDLRERRSAEEKIRYLAEHDGLTGLANRTVMQARLNQALGQAAATGQSLAVICIDLDHFKEANDLHGHLAGDAVLADVAKRLQRSVEAPSFAARLGGDEFVVVQIGGGDQPAAAAGLCGELLDILSAPVRYMDQDLPVGASLGVSLYPEDAQTGETLLANADMALYRAKEDGRGAYRFFKREMDETIRERRTVARELRHAITADELILHYQPQARAEDGEVCGFEALVRWKHPVRGLVPPLEFIPVAEETGLILPLGEWVLRKACADAAAWDKPLRIAVNLSPLQLNQPNLASLVHEVLLESGLAPRRLELEVTESALFKDYQRALDNLRRLKALGVRIAMDDFGTGFSSLSTLQSFPFDKIKIDKSFVEQIHRHDRATAIVRAVLGLGRSLDIPVTAEGVETAEQLEFLRGEACAEVQGYAIGRPAPLETLSDWTEDEPATAKKSSAA